MCIFSVSRTGNYIARSLFITKFTFHLFLVIENNTTSLTVSNLCKMSKGGNRRRKPTGRCASSRPFRASSKRPKRDMGTAASREPKKEDVRAHNMRKSLWCAACSSQKDSRPMFVTWEDFDNHAEETHSAAVRFVEEHFSLFIFEVVRCEETMSILNSLVVESEDRPTFVYQDAGYLTTDVLRRIAMTTNVKGYPQPVKPIGPFENCAQKALFILACVHRWRNDAASFQKVLCGTLLATAGHIRHSKQSRV